jgi:protein tyrosine/serine phosphatase
VLNLRGDAGETTEDELRTAEELGLNVVSIHLSSNILPSPGVLAELIDAIETAKLPMLMHCQAGVDRSGAASVLAAMAIGRENYDKAKWQAYVPPGPWKRRDKANYVHISDLFKGYEGYRKVSGRVSNDWEDFKQWASAGYAQQVVR